MSGPLLERFKLTSRLLRSSSVECQTPVKSQRHSKSCFPFCPKMHQALVLGLLAILCHKVVSAQSSCPSGSLPFTAHFEQVRKVDVGTNGKEHFHCMIEIFGEVLSIYFRHDLAIPERKLKKFYPPRFEIFILRFCNDAISMTFFHYRHLNPRNQQFQVHVFFPSWLFDHTKKRRPWKCITTSCRHCWDSLAEISAGDFSLGSLLGEVCRQWARHFSSASRLAWAIGKDPCRYWLSASQISRPIRRRYECISAWSYSQIFLVQCWFDIWFPAVHWHAATCWIGKCWLVNTSLDSISRFFLVFCNATSSRYSLFQSFMPEGMASGNETIFHYKGNITPPKKWSDWADLLTNFAKHLLERYLRISASSVTEGNSRYGPEEVHKWYFETWNEPNCGFWTGTQQDYFQLLKVTSAALKAVDPKIQGKDFSEFLWFSF